MEKPTQGPSESDSCDQSPDLISPDKAACQKHPAKANSGKVEAQSELTDPTFDRVDPNYHFCYRISCRAVLTSRKQPALEVKLRDEGTPQLKQDPIDEKELSRAFPKKCILYINVFRHSRTPAPAGSDPSKWNEIPFIFDSFNHHGGDLLIKISGSVCISSRVMAAVVRPRDEFWAILNQKVIIKVQQMLETTWNLVAHKFINRSRDPMHFYQADRQSYLIKQGYKDCKNSRMVPAVIKVIDSAEDEKQVQKLGQGCHEVTADLDGIQGSSVEGQEVLNVSTRLTGGGKGLARKASSNSKPLASDQQSDHRLDKYISKDQSDQHESGQEKSSQSGSLSSNYSLIESQESNHKEFIANKMHDRVWIKHNIVSNGYLHLKLMLPAFVTLPKKSILLDMNEQILSLKHLAPDQKDSPPEIFTIFLHTRCDADKAKAVYSRLDNSVTVLAPLLEMKDPSGDMNSLN